MSLAKMPKSDELARVHLQPPPKGWMVTPADFRPGSCEEFDRLLARALAVDVDRRPEWRLANLVAQRRARWLLSRTDALFY